MSKFKVRSVDFIPEKECIGKIYKYVPKTVIMDTELNGVQLGLKSRDQFNEFDLKSQVWFRTKLCDTKFSD